MRCGQRRCSDDRHPRLVACVDLAARLPAAWVRGVAQSAIHRAVRLPSAGDKMIAQITATQFRVLTAIQRHIETNGIPPTQREIAIALRTCVSNVNKHIQNLRALGVLVDAPVLERTTAPASGVRVIVTY